MAYKSVVPVYGVNCGSGGKPCIRRMDSLLQNLIHVLGQSRATSDGYGIGWWKLSLLTWHEKCTF